MSFPGAGAAQFTLPETDPGRLCTVNEPIEIEGKNAVLTTLYVSPLSLTCEIKQGTDDLKETVEPIYSDEGKESIAPEVTLQSGETVGAADWPVPYNEVCSISAGATASGWTKSLIRKR